MILSHLHDVVAYGCKTVLFNDKHIHISLHTC
jgi:hypothetical protein